MDLSLSEEQEMLKNMGRDFLTDKCPKSLVKKVEMDGKWYPPELWQEMAGLGWMGLVIPEKYGGSGMSLLDLTILVEEMGRACLPGPFFSTVVLGSLTIMDIGTDEQKEKYLPKIAGGEAVFTLALIEQDASFNSTSIKVKATKDKGDYVIDGIKLFVPDASVANYILCVARTSQQKNPEGGITLFLVDVQSPGLSSTVLKTIAGDKLCKVVFTKVRVPEENIIGELDHGWGEVTKIMERAAVVKCCETIGGIQQVLEMTVDYAKERKQFNRPIGSFQIIQHYCANMATDVDGTRLSAYHAAWMLTEGIPCRKEVAIAKAWVGDACQRSLALAHQIHGAIGITMDHDLQLYTRRLKAATTTFGDGDFHREIVAQEMGL